MVACQCNQSYKLRCMQSILSIKQDCKGCKVSKVGMDYIPRIISNDVSLHDVLSL